MRCHILMCSNHEISWPEVEIHYLEDYPELFDFGRYDRILSSPYLKGEELVLLVNDTLGRGRKFNLPLILFLVMGVCIKQLLPGSRYQYFAPVDSNSTRRWICPYFLLSTSSSLKKLDFIHWSLALRATPKDERSRMWIWLNSGWRNAESSTLKLKIIKYKTLLLEGRLLSDHEIRSSVFGFHRRSPFRILNSLLG